ncbi:hypothetical protein Tel_08925 [Candidatus Tenderia electrophaga]|jgi:hypothetical protein|uniref:Uncharacterized protein n=1 Tax=Candidatus Tenderia electrophaga TaxID=1748243 RepID=A0A0S2TDR2_9GAMM|nr:hypothetical protein Tel_08925 [Candidatus Tenderia electrophaga]
MTQQGKAREDQSVDRRFQDAEKRTEAKQAYIYKDSGLVENHGYVPRWLILVAVGLLIWGAYYLYAYWQSPGG